MKPLRPRDEAVYLETLKCQILAVYPEVNRATVKFSNSIDRTVPLDTLRRIDDTPFVTTH